MPEETAPTDIVSAAALAVAFASVKPGAVIRYHEGDLFSDRKASVVAAIAAAALALERSGVAELVQRRRGAGDYEYLIVKRHVDRSPTESSRQNSRRRQRVLAASSRIGPDGR